MKESKMLEIESKVIDKTKASKSDHEYRVNNSPDFNTYLKLAYELKSIEEMAKKKKSEMAPFETKVREDALHLMEDRKDFENFKWVDAKKIGEVTVILADRFPSINDEICTIVKEYGYKEGDFFDAEYIVDNAVVLECPEIMQDIQALASKWAKEKKYILKKQTKVKSKTLDKLKSLKDARLFNVLRPVLSLRLR